MKNEVLTKWAFRNKLLSTTCPLWAVSVWWICLKPWPWNWLMFSGPQRCFLTAISNSLDIKRKFWETATTLKQQKSLTDFFFLQRVKDQKPCSLGLYCSVCEKELLPVVHGNFWEISVSVYLPRLNNESHHHSKWTFHFGFDSICTVLTSFFRCIATCGLWVWTPDFSEKKQIKSCSDNPPLPVCTTSATGFPQLRLTAGSPKSHITEGPKDCSAALLWSQFNWWVGSWFDERRTVIKNWQWKTL